MGLGVDLEEAARPADYYDIFADPRDDEAPPVWGYRAPGCWSRMSFEDRICIPILIVTLLATVLCSGAYIYVAGLNPASFAGGLAGYGGIDPGSPGRVVSPEFGVTLRINNTCVDRANVVVAYAGVALGWARAEPWDCEEERRTKEVEVVAKGEGVGMPEHLRDHMAEEWRRSGTLELDVEVEIFRSSDSDRAAGDFPRKVVTCMQGEVGWTEVGDIALRVVCFRASLRQ
ncbi:hypothetical protein HU200_055186 [Digitaria exilis]|uniref:Late embryogenesis abundant protein LEA-2 subgroup domain-containing protein n=1 Tax=Digitaria exilis TaxID=1010633 RepID=A0A835AJM8_9POAL|nr:hypothetical protein HU200_055186 [Digitaria exilis]